MYILLIKNMHYLDKWKKINSKFITNKAADFQLFFFEAVVVNEPQSNKDVIYRKMIDRHIH